MPGLLKVKQYQLQTSIGSSLTVLPVAKSGMKTLSTASQSSSHQPNSIMKQLLLKPDKFHVCPVPNKELRDSFKDIEGLWLCSECHPTFLKASKFIPEGLKGYVASRLLARLTQEQLEGTLAPLAINIRDNIMAIFQSDCILKSSPRTTVRVYIKTVAASIPGSTININAAEVIVYLKTVRCLSTWGEYEIYEIPILVNIEFNKAGQGNYEIEGFLADEHKPEYNSRRKRRRFSTLEVIEEGGS